MATSETKEKTCVVCLEAPAVKKVDTCQHFYCENCLSSPDFACPQCVIEGYGGQGVNSTGGPGKEGQPDGTGAPELATKNLKKTGTNCKICHFNGEPVRATHVCIKCKQLPLCVNCSIAHRLNKATQKHVVTVIGRSRNDRCTIHDEPLELVCASCSENICHVCMSIEHVGHEIETINEAVFVEFDEVRIGMEYQKKWLEMLRSDEKELKELKASAQEMEDVLIKSIEDHAEKCIEEILKNKEVLKKQVRADHEVVRVMEKRLEAMPELQKASADVAAAADQLLSEQAELHSTYIEQLVVFKQKLDKLQEAHPAYKMDRANYQQTFSELRGKAVRFYPRKLDCEIGGFRDPGPICGAGGPCVCETCEEEFKWPNFTREAECRQKGICTCGTCECVFNRSKLYGDGRCNEIEGGYRCGSRLTSNFGITKKMYRFP
ncbi:E3 ubiquitin-protein ligase TRIM17-like [Lineus longissimus]|uniref:E3 ubiquitin-protein ligase TRIM17-like n=1 Tax=Lineus longissimus TaxID=88925 RepID=UPI00315CF2E5